MSGFLTLYSQIERVEVAEDYWIDVRKHINRGAARRANAILMQPVMQMDSEGTPNTSAPVNFGDYQTEVAMDTFVNWNLTDENDVPLPLSPEDAKRESLDKLPSDVFDKALAVVEGLAKKKPAVEKEKDRQFPR